MNPTWKAAIGVILVFILGWFGGALTTLIIAHHRMLVVIQHDPESMARMLDRQTIHNLGLDEDRKRQLHALFVENIRQRLELQKQIQPQVKALNRQSLQEINALLTPDQQEHFHENLLVLKQRFGRNPFSVGADDKPTQTEQVGTGGDGQAPSK
jgi:hypothetical protein